MAGRVSAIDESLSSVLCICTMDIELLASSFLPCFLKRHASFPSKVGQLDDSTRPCRPFLDASAIEHFL